MEGLPSDPMQQGMSGIAPPGAAPGAPPVPAVPPELPGTAGSWYARNAARNRAQMDAAGIEPLSPLRWLNRLTQSGAYSAMIGPASAFNSAIGNAVMPILSTPREITRPIYRALRTGNVNALREYPKAAWALQSDLMDMGRGALDALAARGQYASSPNHPNLSAQTVNPFGKALAQSLELGNRAFSGLPDAIFGTLSRNYGERLKAAQMATDLGLKGGDWSNVADGLIKDARAARAGGESTSAHTADMVAAIEEADNQGLKGTERAQAIGQWLQQVSDRKQGQLVANPDIADRIMANGKAALDGIVSGGQTYADHQTFRDALGKVGRAARGASGADLPVVGPAITPFFNTNWNVWKRLAEHSPVGPLANRNRAGYDKAFDAVYGTVLLGGLASYATDGRVTGSGPSDPQKRQELKDNGWQPYSTLILGTYVPNRTFGGPFEEALNLAGDWHDHVAYQKPGEAYTQASFNDMATRLGEQIKSAPTLQGWSNLVDALSSQNVASGLERLASDQITSHVPYAATARAIGTALDPYARTADRGKLVPAAQTIAEQVSQGLGQRSDLPVAQTALGAPQQNPQQGLGAFLPAMRSPSVEPVSNAFLKSQVDISAPRTEMSIAGATVPLQPDEQRRWNTLRGEQLQRIVGPMAQNGSLDQMDPTARNQLLQTLLHTANQIADAQMQGSLPNLSQRVQDALALERLKKAS